MLMNSKTIHFEIMKNNTLGFNIMNLTEKQYLDVVKVTALLEYCTIVLLIQQFEAKKHVKLLHFTE